MKSALPLSAFGLLSVFAATAHASILPPNNLHLQDNPTIMANITEEEFNGIVNRIIGLYKPLAVQQGATLKSNNLWSDTTVNASASQTGTSWIINMYGGLARRPEVTPDGFALVVCHELGHHFGGFAFYGDQDWAASEGQSDYFATQACARKIWSADKVENAKFRTTVGDFEKSKCDATWRSEDEQNLCYRSAAAGYSLASLLSALGRGSAPRFDTPDPKQVPSTFVNHPQGQCRLDTYFTGALCTSNFKETLIPGRRHASGQRSVEAETIASETSCMTSAGFTEGVRPRCWFKPNLEFLGIKFGFSDWNEKSGNNNQVIEPGESLDFTFTLANGSQKATTGVRASLSSASPGVTILNKDAIYPDLGVGESKVNAEPFVVKVDEAAQCGATFNLKLNAASDHGAAEFTKSFQIGKLVQELAGKVTGPVAIPDNFPTGIVSEITSTTSGAIGKASVKLDITHTYPRDLRISLVAPNGNSVVLFPVGTTERGIAKKNKADARVRAFADKGIHETFTVDMPVENAAGVWKLKVTDAAAVDIGTLDNWELTLSKAVCEN